MNSRSSSSSGISLGLGLGSGSYTRPRRKKSSMFSPYFKKLLNWSHMDFEYASWEMLYLIISPKRVYKNIYYHKQTKNQWARDDPAFILLQLLGLVVVSTSYALVYGAGLQGLAVTLSKLVLLNYFAVGAGISTFACVFSNQFLLHRNIHVSEQVVEWQYAFDVHCNAFFPFFLIVYVVQFFFLPVLMRPSWISLFLGNTLYALAFAQYVYISYLGYQALPFLQRQAVYLYPLALVTILYFTSLFGFNISQNILDFYF